MKKRDDTNTRAQCNHLRCKHSCACADTPYNNGLGDHAVFDGVTNFVFLCTTNLYNKYNKNTFLNSLGPKSDQHQFSANNISRSSRVKVMRITKLTTKGRSL